MKQVSRVVYKHWKEASHVHSDVHSLNGGRSRGVEGSNPRGYASQLTCFFSPHLSLFVEGKRKETEAERPGPDTPGLTVRTLPLLLRLRHCPVLALCLIILRLTCPDVTTGPESPALSRFGVLLHYIQGVSISYGNPACNRLPRWFRVTGF